MVTIRRSRQVVVVVFFIDVSGEFVTDIVDSVVYEVSNSLMIQMMGCTKRWGRGHWSSRRVSEHHFI
jgi:hypothetical protein